MAECIAQRTLNCQPTLLLTVAFDAPHISSDGGVLLLRQMADRLGLSARLAALLPDERDPRKVQHDRREQMRQQLYQLALGYVDCSDADRLRPDPLLQSVWDRTPQAGGLSSQPTLSRLENAGDARPLRTVLREIEVRFLLHDDRLIATLEHLPDAAKLSIEVLRVDPSNCGMPLERLPSGVSISRRE